MGMARKTTNGANKSQKGQAVPNFTEAEAIAYFERMRWPDGPICINCGCVDGVYHLQGKSTRPGLLKCRECKAQFSVTVDTVMEDTHLPLSLWAKAFHLMASSKKGVSALQIQRQLGIGSYRTAWHLCHRIRYAMEADIKPGMLKGQVQVDECYVGGKPRPGDGKVHKRGRGTSKTPVVALVETDGNVRSKPVERVDGSTLAAALNEVVDKSSQIVTDELSAYPAAVAGYAGHETVNHSQEQYARKQVNEKGETQVFHTNTAESYFSLLKRGIIGSFHHVSKKHLHRYCSEFDFRWNGIDLMDTQRRDAAVRGGEGKRLFYKMPIGQA